MNVSLAQLRSLVYLARHGSFTKAAAALHRTQPAISAQIRELEAELGLKLVDRTTRDVRLNTVGTELAPVLSGILADLDRVLDTARRLKDYQTGTISIGCLPSFAAGHLPAKIVEFRKAYPAIRFYVRDAGERSVVRLVEEGEVEFGVTTKVAISSLVKGEDIMEDPFEVVFPAGHPIESAKVVDVDELAKYELILMAHVSGGLRSIIDAGFANHKRVIIPHYEAIYFTTAISLVRAGLGISILNASIVPRRDPELRSRLIEAKGFSRTTSLVTRLNRTLSPAAQAFYDLLKSNWDSSGKTRSNSSSARRKAPIRPRPGGDI